MQPNWQGLFITRIFFPERPGIAYPSNSLYSEIVQHLFADYMEVNAKRQNYFELTCLNPFFPGLGMNENLILVSTPKMNVNEI